MKVWFWCLHCERTFSASLPDDAKKDEYGHWEDAPENCAYLGCDGHIGDIWNWDKVRENNPEYPEVPTKGQRSALYPDESGISSADFEKCVAEVKLDENEFWCVSLNNAGLLLGLSPGKVRVQILAGRLYKVFFLNKSLVPVSDIAKFLGQTDEEVLNKAAESKMGLTMLGVL